MIDTSFLKRYADSAGSICEDILDIDDGLTDICWLPISNSIIEPDNWQLFWQLWTEQKTSMSPDGEDSAIWESLCIWKSPTLPESDIIHSQYPQKVVDWSELFPKMFQQVFTVMPFSEIWKITLATNIKRVPAHVDRPQFSDEAKTSQFEILSPWPNSVRVLLHDTNTQPTFYLTPWPQKLLERGKIQDPRIISEWGFANDPRQNEKCYVQLPDNTNTFVFSNGAYLHGADYFGKSKLLLLIWGKPDSSAWKAKLRELIQKFPDFQSTCKFK